MKDLPATALFISHRAKRCKRVFSPGKIRGKRRVAVLFNLRHFYRICKRSAWSEGKERR